MFDFDQYLGFLAFLTILTIGFWLMIFLISFIPYWITGWAIETIKLAVATPQKTIRIPIMPAGKRAIMRSSRTIESSVLCMMV